MPRIWNICVVVTSVQRPCRMMSAAAQQTQRRTSKPKVSQVDATQATKRVVLLAMLDILDVKGAAMEASPSRTGPSA